MSTKKTSRASAAAAASSSAASSSTAPHSSNNHSASSALASSPSNPREVPTIVASSLQPPVFVPDTTHPSFRDFPPSFQDRRYLRNCLTQLSGPALELVIDFMMERYSEEIYVTSNRSIRIPIQSLSTLAFRDLEELVRVSLGDDDEYVHRPYDTGKIPSSMFLHPGGADPMSDSVLLEEEIVPKVKRHRIHGPQLNRTQQDQYLTLHNVPVTLLGLQTDTDRPYVCNFEGCGKAFYAKDKVARHIESIHEKHVAQLVASVDGGATKGAEGRLQDRDVFSAISGIPVKILKLSDPADLPWICMSEGCTLAFKTRGGLARHVNIHVRAWAKTASSLASMRDPNENQEDLPREERDETQDLRFALRGRWHATLLSKKDRTNTPWICNDAKCGPASQSRFSTKEALLAHCRIAHGAFSCPKCRERFLSSADLSAHVKTHFTCSVCTKAFHSNEAVVAHQRRNHKGIPASVVTAAASAAAAAAAAQQHQQLDAFSS